MKSSYFPEDNEDSQCWDDIIASVPRPETLAFTQQSSTAQLRTEQNRPKIRQEKRESFKQTKNLEEYITNNQVSNEYPDQLPKQSSSFANLSTHHSIVESGNSSPAAGPFTIYQSHMLPLIALFESPLKELLVRSHLRQFKDNESYLTGKLLPWSTFKQQYENNVALSCLAWSTSSSSQGSGGAVGEAWVLLTTGSSECIMSGGGLHFPFTPMDEHSTLSMKQGHAGTSSTGCESLIENELCLNFSSSLLSNSLNHVGYNSQEIMIKVQSQLYGAIKALHLTPLKDISLFPTPLAQAMTNSGRRQSANRVMINTKEMHHGYLSRHQNGMIIPLFESEAEKFAINGVWVDIGEVPISTTDQLTSPSTVATLSSKQLIRHPLVWAAVSKFTSSNQSTVNKQHRSEFFLLAIFVNGTVSFFQCSCDFSTPRTNSFDFMADVRLGSEETSGLGVGALVVVGTLKPSIVDDDDPDEDRAQSSNFMMRKERQSQFGRLTPASD